MLRQIEKLWQRMFDSKQKAVTHNVLAQNSTPHDTYFKVYNTLLHPPAHEETNEVDDIDDMDDMDFPPTQQATGTE